MNNQQRWISSLIFFVLFSVILNNQTSAQPSNKTYAPLLGWNSYNCYGSNADAKILSENLDVFIEKLKPFGYEYFVIDAGWYRHYDLKQGEKWPSKGDKAHLNIDEYGRFIPSKTLFPNDFKDIIDRAHKHGIKFGLHLMRGIPREAVKKKPASKSH
jgi:alpha-galactosidase